MADQDPLAQLEAENAALKAELDEFRTSSKELEEELERELERAQAENGTLKARADQARKEADDWKERFNALQRSSAGQISELELERDALRAQAAKDASRIRELEIGNDELEMATRVAMSSIQDLQTKYNQTLERMVYLQEELDVAKEMSDDLQRMKDELRDANLEISVLRSRSNSANSSPGPSPHRPAPMPGISERGDATPSPSPAPGAPVSPTALAESLSNITLESPKPPETPQKPAAAPAVPQTPSTPSAALALVNSVTSASVGVITDLLSKAKAIEGRLAAARAKYISPLLIPSADSKSGQTDAASDGSNDTRLPGAWDIERTPPAAT
ncbi:hypothetical protein DFJ74DRAFT_664596 [Hyaloraphidium curvatum]|nr:hypothetical protein DFJ74DRAFT_664596 [Hyaloraphidium curvatum]